MSLYIAADTRFDWRMDELMHVVKRMQVTSRVSGRTKARLVGAGADGSGGDFGV